MHNVSTGLSQQVRKSGSTFLSFVVTTLLVLVIGASTAWAQATSGDIVGTVTDSTGAAIAGATVTAKNVTTGVATTVTTSNVGDYHISNLLAGTYDISASATGFKTFTLQKFTVNLNNTATAKLVLPVASSATNVEVSAEAPAVIDTTTVQLQSSFETEELKNFPTATVGNGVLNLSLLVPGVASSGAVGAGTGPSVGGQRPRADNYQVEGIDNNNKSVTGPLVYIPNDAVGEFTVVVNQFSPEFGHSAGGQFNTTVTSGTNKIHGSAYEYFQNRNLNAENAIAGGKVSNPRYDFNRYGGQVGGPLKKDKLFYFANFERQTVGQSSSFYLCTPTAAGMTMLGTVPNLSATNLGIFTKYVPASQTQVTDANDLACFGAAGPQTLTVYSGTGLNADGVYGDGTKYFVPLGNVNIQAPNYSNFNALTTSGDWTISPKDSFRLRYIYNKFTGIDTAAALPAFYQPIPDDFHLMALSEYHNFTPGLINEARLGYNRFFNITPSGNFTYPGVDSFPTIYTYDVGFLEIGPDGNAPQSTIQNLYQLTDNVTWVKGKHNFKLGFDGRKFISPQSFTQRVRGDYEYDALTEYLHDLTPTAFGERSTGNFFYYGDQTAFYGYGNDVWRVTDKLSLNYGLRYEFTSVPTGEKTQILNKAASVPGLINFKTPAPQRLDFLPRVGINYAWDVNTSIRAGFGMASDVLYDNLGILSFPPQFSSTNDVDTTFLATPKPNTAGYPNFLANGGLPHGTGTLATFATIQAQQAATSAFVPDQKLPYAETWTLGVQHVFAKDYTAEVRYVGTRGIHLPTQNQLNVQSKIDADHYLPTYINNTPGATDLAKLPNTLDSINARPKLIPAFTTSVFNAVTNPNPDPNGTNFAGKITSFQPYSESNYNGLATSLTRRFQKGFLLDAAYTWSKTMDDATADVFSTVLTPRRPQDPRNVKGDYSRSALDRNQRLTIAVVYDLPYFKQSTWVVKNIIGNWEIAPIYTYESPEYYTVLSGTNSNLNGDSTAIDRTVYNKSGKRGTGSGIFPIYDPGRASLCPEGVSECSGNLVAYQATDPTAMYVMAGKGAMPTSQRNTEPIRPIDNFDATAIKRFSFGERYAFEFSAQAFNVFNHSQFIPGTIDNINSPGYTSQITFQTAGLLTTKDNPAGGVNTGFNQPTDFFTANARSMQLSTKFTF